MHFLDKDASFWGIQNHGESKDGKHKYRDGGWWLLLGGTSQVNVYFEGKTGQGKMEKLYQFQVD
jgi:hypothetical protein